jgi:hypothetical protein
MDMDKGFGICGGRWRYGIWRWAWAYHGGIGIAGEAREGALLKERGGGISGKWDWEADNRQDDN